MKKIINISQIKILCSYAKEHNKCTHRDYCMYVVGGWCYSWEKDEFKQYIIFKKGNKNAT
jgi:hypothetical protein